MSDLSPLCAQERTSQKGETLQPLHRSKPDISRFRARRWFYRCTLPKKLDGTARGGILVALAEKHKLPVHFIGVGEGIDDLAPFTARDFAQAIAGIE